MCFTRHNRVDMNIRRDLYPILYTVTSPLKLLYSLYLVQDALSMDYIIDI